MAYEDSLLDLEQYNDTLLALMLADSTTNIGSNKSVRKIVNENVGVNAKLWSSTENYSVGVLVSFNSVIYISKTDNINKQPDINTDDFEYYNAATVAGSKGFDKVLRFNKDGVITKGEEFFSSVEGLGSGRFRLHFTTPIIGEYFVFDSIENIDSSDLTKYNMSIYDQTENYVTIQSYDYTKSMYDDAPIYNIFIMRGN